MNLKIRTGWFLTLVACLPTFAAKPPAAPAPPSFGETVEVNVVNVDVYVTDKNGNRVTGLKKEDFALSEEEKPVEITNFAAVAERVESPAITAKPGIASEPRPGEPAPGPESWLNLAVFVDNLHLRPENRARALEQIRKFLAQTVRPLDRVMLASYDLGLRVRRPFTGDPAVLDTALRQMETLPSFGVQADQARRSALRAMYSIHELNPCSFEMMGPIQSYAEQSRDEAQRTVGALKFLVNSLAGIPGRKAVLYVSDGVPVTPGEELFQAVYEICGGGTATSGLPETNQGGKVAPGADAAGYPAQQALLDAQKYSIAERFEDLAAHANANRVAFYTLQASGLRGAAADPDLDPGERVLQLMTVQQVQRTNWQNSLSAMAAGTGGRAMLNTNDFLPDLGKMQEDFSVYYSLAYTPAHAGDGRQHRIEVKVKRPGLKVRYRQSYRDKPLAERIVDRTLAALFHGIEDNPLEVSMEIGDPSLGEKGEYGVPIRLKIPIFKLAVLNQQETFRAKLRLLVATGDDQGGISPVRQVEVPIEFPRKQVLNAMGKYYLYNLTLKMRSGEQRVAIAVRDEIGATTSYLSRPVTVGATAAAVVKP
ncbi:MAG TPA: VWA domain-containing protein [Thermoanaerobaculia bacterium]|jgi:VWFA-related protein|nr:VWA domain-containing protein [Thermoanaerobaculia bacterium]